MTHSVASGRGLQDQPSSPGVRLEKRGIQVPGPGVDPFCLPSAPTLLVKHEWLPYSGTGHTESA
ncbi:unnamed protein product, partial [Rangifer tarandus platyrhynchus]